MNCRYAIDLAGRIISADNLKATDRGNNFICLGCSEPLTPKMGKRVRWHFAHRPGTLCGGLETYLHKLGKQVFYDTYIACLATSKPFWIELYQASCPRALNRLGAGCGVRQLNRFDLTRYFRQVVMEQPYGAFIPDLLLLDLAGKAGVMIEICVTHSCSAEKLAAGKRIIEIPLRHEAEADKIKLACLREDWKVCLLSAQASYPARCESPVHFYNFERQARQSNGCICLRRPHLTQQ